MSNRGFTLIEVLVTISIIILLSSILLPNYHSLQERFALLRAAHRLSQNLRRAQEMATSARALAGTVPPGYGIWLVTGDTSYLLYADNGSQSEAYDVGDATVETIDLEGETFIKEISVSPVSINFRGPDPITRIYGPPEVESLMITLALSSDPGQVQRIRVNQAGLIYVE